MFRKISNNIQKAFRNNKEIYHFKVNFPLSPSKLESCLSKLRNSKQKQPRAIALSINASIGNKSHYNILYDSFSFTAQSLKIPLYTFIEDQATTEGYALACSGLEVFANPYSVIGEIGSFKTYVNVRKLLNLLNIQYQQLGVGQKSFWNHFTGQQNKQQPFTKNYLNQLQSNMIKLIKQRRGISQRVLQQIKGKLISPKTALKLNLIDKIQTFQQFKQSNYQQYKVVEYTFEKGSYNIEMNQTQINLFKKLLHFFQSTGPQMYFYDESIIHEFKNILQNRIGDQDFLDFLDQKLAPEIFAIMDQYLKEDNLINI